MRRWDQATGFSNMNSIALIKTVILLVAFEGNNNTQHVRDFAYDDSTVPCLAALL
jgi:hypothetical protein